MKGYSGCGPVPAHVATLLPNAEELAKHCARTAFASTWADAVEREKEARAYPEREESKRRDVRDAAITLPNLSGCDVLELAPMDAMPLRFLAYGRDVVTRAVLLACEEFNAHDILERWNGADDEELGHNFALEALGTGAAEFEEESDGELVPTMDADGRLYVSLAELEPDADPTDAELRELTPRALRLLDPTDVRNAELAEEQRVSLVRAIREAMDGSDVETALETVSELLRWHGVESLELPDDDGTRLYYVNTGDTYNTTLTHDGKRYRVESWGSAVERAEEYRTESTGETRCPACGEWGDSRGDRPCPHCGNVN